GQVAACVSLGTKGGDALLKLGHLPVKIIAAIRAATATTTARICVLRWPGRRDRVVGAVDFGGACGLSCGGTLVCHLAPCAKGVANMIGSGFFQRFAVSVAS